MALTETHCSGDVVGIPGYCGFAMAAVHFIITRHTQSHSDTAVWRCERNDATRHKLKTRTACRFRDTSLVSQIPAGIKLYYSVHRSSAFL